MQDPCVRAVELANGRPQASRLDTDLADGTDQVAARSLGPVGLEHRDRRGNVKPGNTKTSDDMAYEPGKQRVAESSASGDLDRVVQAWPTLPQAIRAGVLAMVEAARTGRQES